MMRIRAASRSGFVSFLVLAAGWLLGSLTAHAAEPADAQIKSALADIQRYEQQLAGNSQPNAATVKRTLRLLTITRDRLDSSPNKSHPSWEEADSRLRALVARLQAPAQSASPAPRSTPSAAATSRPPTPASTAPAQMISQYRVRIKKLIRDIASATQTMDQNGPKPFQSEDYVAKQVQRGEAFQVSLARFSEYSQDSDVVAATEALAKYNNMIAFGKDYAAKEIAAIGDVQAGLAALDANHGRVPDAPTLPTTSEAVQTWIVTLAKMRQEAATAVQQLAVYKERAYLPLQSGPPRQGGAYDFQDVDRLNASYRDNVSKIDAALEQFKADLDLNIEHIADTLTYVEELDPEDDNDQIKGFLGAGSADEVRGQLHEAHQLAEVAVGFDQLIKREEQRSQHGKVLAGVEAAQKAYEAKYQRARESVRLPKAASKDRKLLATAKETLANPSYEIGDIRRMVINADKVHREKKTSTAEFDKVDVSLSGTVTLSGTETTYFYSWDEFQVATAEPVEDTFFIYYNTLKYFTSGSTTTPLNRWVLSGRIQGSEIPEANIERD